MGSEVGFIEGLLVGFPVGFPVGLTVGLTVGFPVAFIKGCKEGVSVDAIVGSRVGILGGLRVDDHYVLLGISIGVGPIRPVLMRHLEHFLNRLHRVQRERRVAE